MTKYDIAELAATKAAPLFRAFGWTYRGEKEPPTHQKLQNTVEELIDHCDEDGTASTGRFIVERYSDEDGQRVRVSLYLYEGPLTPDE
jgi:hypothetical protein